MRSIPDAFSGTQAGQDSQVAEDETHPRASVFCVPGHFGQARFVYGEAVVSGSSNTALPHIGVVFRNAAITREEREENERKTREEFSENHSFVPLATPRYGGTL